MSYGATIRRLSIVSKGYKSASSPTELSWARIVLATSWSWVKFCISESLASLATLSEKNVRLQNIVSDNDLQCITNEVWFSEKKSEMAMMFPYLFVNIRQYSVNYKNLMWTGCLLCNPCVVGGPVVPWIDSSCLIWTLLLGDLQIVLCIGLILVPNKTCNEQITSFSPECFKVEVYLGVELIAPFKINERFTQFIMIYSWWCHWLLMAVICMAVNCRKR